MGTPCQKRNHRELGSVTPIAQEATTREPLDFLSNSCSPGLIQHAINKIHTESALHCHYEKKIEEADVVMKYARLPKSIAMGY